MTKYFATKKEQAIFDIAEKQGWTVCYEKSIDGKSVEFRQFSPAGEDFSFTVNYTEDSELDAGICKFYGDFDVDEHIESWIEAKKQGVGGIPSIRALCDDAEAINTMLENFAEAVFFLELNKIIFFKQILRRQNNG